MYFLFHVQWPSFVRVFQSYHSLTRVYYYVINEEGQPTYIGTHTSVISYNKSISSWVWWDWTGFYENGLQLLFARYDKKDPSSEAVSRSSPASLLLGLQKMSSLIIFLAQFHGQRKTTQVSTAWTSLVSGMISVTQELVKWVYKININNKQYSDPSTPSRRQPSYQNYEVLNQGWPCGYICRCASMRISALSDVCRI